MENNEGISFIILIEKSNPNLRTQLRAMTTLCDELGYNYEVMVFVKSPSSEIEKVLQNVQNAYQIKYKGINFYPGALRIGVKQAKYERVLVCCSDEIVTAHCIKQMILGLEHYHLVCGVRLTLKQGLRISIYSWCWHKLVRLLFHVRLRDINCPYKVFLRSKVEEIGYLESSGTLAHTELIARMKARRMNIAEFPLESFRFDSEERKLQPTNFNLDVL